MSSNQIASLIEAENSRFHDLDHDAVTGNPDSSPLPQGSTSAGKHQKASGRPIMIAVMGATGSGKSSFINLASGSNLRVGDELESCTADVQLANVFALDGRRILLIDTPGFDDSSMSDTDVLKRIAAFLATTYEKKAKLAGVIFIHRITDVRFTGISQRNFQMFRELCGERTLKNVVLVTNMWDGVPYDVGESREKQLSSNYFKQAIGKGAQMTRHLNTEQSAHDIVRMIMRNTPVVLQIQRELVDERRDIVNTSAGDVINRELNEQIRKHEGELKEVQEQAEQALKEKDEEAERELEEERQRLQEQIKEIKEESDGMASKYAEEKEKTNARVKEMQQKAKEENERVQAEAKREIADITRRLKDVAEKSKAEKERLEKELQDAQDKLNDAEEEGGCCVVM